MASVEIAIGVTWVLLGATMVYSGIVDRSIIPAPVANAFRLPLVMIGFTTWVMRFSLRASLGGSGKAKASR